MALGAQLSPTQTLVTFCLWAHRHGYDVGEMHGFSAVHPVHAGGSWHFDSDGGFGKAADINKNGPDERARAHRGAEPGAGAGSGRDLRPGRVRGGQPGRTRTTCTWTSARSATWVPGRSSRAVAGTC